MFRSDNFNDRMASRFPVLSSLLLSVSFDLSILQVIHSKSECLHVCFDDVAL